MEVWFLIEIAWKTPLKTNSSPGKLEFTDLPTEFYSFTDGLEFSSIALYGLKWNKTFNDIKA